MVVVASYFIKVKDDNLSLMDNVTHLLTGE